MGSKLIFCLWMLLLTNGVFGVGTAEMERPSVILHTDVKEYNQIKWMFGPQKWNIASCNIRDTSPCEVTLGTEELINTFRDSLQIDNNGSLTIRNISIEHAGLYTLQTINKSNKSDERKFNVSVSPPKTVNDNSITNQTKQLCQPCSDSGLNPWLIGGLVLAGVAVAAAAAAVFLYKKFCKKRKAGRNEAEPGTSYIMQEIEPLTVEDTVV